MKNGNTHETSASTVEYERTKKSRENYKNVLESIEVYKIRRMLNNMIDQTNSNNFYPKKFDNVYGLLYKRQDYDFIPDVVYWKGNGLLINKRTSFKSWNSQGVLRKGQASKPWMSWADSFKINN